MLDFIEADGGFAILTGKPTRLDEFRVKLGRVKPSAVKLGRVKPSAGKLGQNEFQLGQHIFFRE